MEMKLTTRLGIGFLLIVLTGILCRTFAAIDKVESEGSGYVCSAYIPSVNQRSETLCTNTLDSGCYEKAMEEFSFWKEKSGAFRFYGTFSGLPFDVVAVPYASPANEHVQVFEARDAYDNYDVLYANVEQNITESALYFDNVDLTPYSNVFKLYLRPTGSEDFVVVELFTSENWAEPYVSRPVSQDPNDPGRVGQFWYTKVFTASVVEEVPDSDGVFLIDTKEWASTIEYSTTYSHLGYDWKQRFSIQLFITYPTTFTNFENFITGYRVVDACTECLTASNESSTASNIEARDLRVNIAVAEGCACSSFKTTGHLKSKNRWSPSDDLCRETQSFEGLDGYVRQFGLEWNDADTRRSLASTDDYWSVDWKMKNYAGTKKKIPFQVRFSYVMVNLMNASEWSGQEVTKEATVYFNTTA